MKIRVKKDEVDFSDQLKVDGNPTILKKETSTNLVVRNNETIVISGLSKQTLTESTSGVPGLADIPGLGWLFKGNSKNDEMEEILIFVTPTILETPSSRPVRAEESASSPSPPPAAE
jgi:type IV pilus assembly protein PilQ